MREIKWKLFIFCCLGLYLSACALGVEPISGEKTLPTPYSLDRGSPFPTIKSSPTRVTPTLTQTIPATLATIETPTSKPKTITPTKSPTTPTCLSLGGSVVTATLRAPMLRLPLEYRVYLPPCYSQQRLRRYPLLVLFHGQGFNDDQWERLGAVETADRLIATGEISPFIMLMPWDRLGGQPADNNLALVIVEELLPKLEDQYRLKTDRQHRAVGGLSRGAGWAVHLALTRWDLFGTLGAHSPAIFYDDAQHMRVYLDKIPSNSFPRIYLDIGDRDRPEITDNAIWFERLLDERSIPHEWHLFSGFHEEAYWSAHVELYLRWYAGEW